MPRQPVSACRARAKRAKSKVRLAGSPQKRGVCTRVYTTRPRSRIRAAQGEEVGYQRFEVIGYIAARAQPAGALVVLIRRASQDLPGVRYHICVAPSTQGVKDEAGGAPSTAQGPNGLNRGLTGD